MGDTGERSFFYAVCVGLVMTGVAYLLGWVWVPAEFSTVDLVLIGLSVATSFANYVNEYLQWYPLKYSKFAPEGMVPARLGWFLMYFTPMVFYIAIWCYTGQPNSDYDLLVLGMYVLHFVKRCTETLIVHKYSKDCCLQTVFEVASFYSLGAGGVYWFAHVSSGDQRLSFMQDRSRVCIGIAIYVLGQLCNLYHHMLLANLRKPGQYGYVIPTGGLFGLIVCPQYFGELLSWFGFGLVGYNMGLLLSGFIPMVVYLSARAHHTHAWYSTKFEDYPGKAVRKIWPYVY